MVQLARSKRQRNRASSLAASDEAPEAAEINSEICVLDDSFAERQQEEGSADRPTALGRKRVRLRFDGRVLAARRHQFMQLRGQAANSAATTVRGCYTLALQELTAWRNRSKVASTATEDTPSSIASSLSSVTDLEDDRRKEFQRSEFSLDERRVKNKSSQCGFAETNCGSHEQLLLVNALPLNDSDDEDTASTTRHLPYRSTKIDGREYILKNQWV
ncbi:hypothetical protein PHYSODRAFT_259208 [Phytophthora sojae]|uniref:Uncharacterized protein n=1 Tax=Phytophthora sojae (strain P6497) TaxID=1094619 RepID=G4ZSA2_PHYSP|nr:hypothetical protein PHYSODRAFT_259208 [Phytophthora sojae]EGZ12998.1 hypothetical protein PHYSODRAFT_259208 [Phytophthora sojae]|eukprot:XP_009530427.1 hypothetical protein PHYSODRAFT_259208 [Phytophthora sojae]